MKHEVLFLNPSRTYVRISDTWYDSHREHNLQVGQSFLGGKVEEVLSYDQYKEQFTDVQAMYNSITERTVSGGFIRRMVGSAVKYAVNPAMPTLAAYSAEKPVHFE